MKNRLVSEVKENGDQIWSERKKDETWECDPGKMNQTPPADAPSLHTHLNSERFETTSLSCSTLLCRTPENFTGSFVGRVYVSGEILSRVSNTFSMAITDGYQ